VHSPSDYIYYGKGKQPTKEDITIRVLDKNDYNKKEI
jgi:hypothetical protein